MSNVPPPQPVPPPWPVVASPLRPPSRWPALVSLVIALVAIGVAIAAWLRPIPAPYKPPPAPTYSSQQVADAKGKVCAAYAKVHQAFAVVGARDGGDDPTAGLAVATSSRQALEVGSRYLLSKLAAEPATDAELAEAMHSIAEAYQELAISYLADARDSDVEPTRQSVDRLSSKIDGLCK